MDDKDHLVELTFRFTESPTATEQILDHLLDQVGQTVTEEEIRGALDL